MSAKNAISIGNFDGVHLGHRALIARARDLVDAGGEGGSGRVVAVTFDPHPMAVLRPGEALARLLPLPDRIARLRSAGADQVEVLDATSAFLATGAEEFIEDLHQRFDFDLVVEGPGFRFGRGRLGSLESLSAIGTRKGFRVEVVEPVEVLLRDRSRVRASSSITRWLLELGRVEDAALVLGQPFELAGRVVRGDQRGRAIGCPTANIDHGDVMLPADGIYAADAILPDGATRAAAVSIGTKPTFGRSERTCEAHLLEFTGWVEEYGWPLRLVFRAWLRDQFRYDSIETLRTQISRDVERVGALCRAPVGVAT